MTAAYMRSRRMSVLVALIAASLITTADCPVSEFRTLASVGARAGTQQTDTKNHVPDQLRATQPLLPASAAGHAVPLDAGPAASTVGVLVVDGGKHQCSASVVVSDSRRLLATAAHCVWLNGKWTLDGAFFVPGYRDGSEPWGRWAVETAWVPRTWQQANSPIENVASAHDVAFVRLAPNPSGQLAEDVLGSQGIWFDSPDAPTVTALGYPLTGPFDGQQLERCTGPAHVEQAKRATGDRDEQSDGEVLVLDCDMTEGASGGPWLTGPHSATGLGQVIGVVSGGVGPDLVSIRFGAEAEQVYRDADTGSGLDTEDTQ